MKLQQSAFALALPSEAKNRAEWPAQHALVQLSPASLHETSGMKVEKIQQKNQLLPNTTTTRTPLNSELQTTFSSSAAQWNTRPPCWTNFARLRRHTACNFTLRKPKSSPIQHQSAADSTLWQSKEWTSRSFGQKAKPNTLVNSPPSKKRCTSRVGVPHQMCVGNIHELLSKSWSFQSTHWGTHSNSSTPIWPHHSSTHQERGRWRKNWRRRSRQRNDGWRGWSYRQKEQQIKFTQLRMQRAPTTPPTSNTTTPRTNRSTTRLSTTTKTSSSRQQPLLRRKQSRRLARTICWLHNESNAQSGTKSYLSQKNTRKKGKDKLSIYFKLDTSNRDDDLTSDRPSSLRRKTVRNGMS